MTSSKSSSEASTADNSATNTINAGIGGDIDESLVNSGNYGDTSLVSNVDESRAYFDYESDDDVNFDYDTAYSYDSDDDFSDSSDNSFNLDLEDHSDSSTDHSVTTITDGGAFQLVDSLTSNLIDTLGESQIKTLDSANALVMRSMDSSTNLAARSLDGAMSIKAGQSITEPANQTMRELAGAGVKVAALAAAVIAVTRVMGGKK